MHHTCIFTHTHENVNKRLLLLNKYLKKFACWPRGLRLSLT